MKKNKLLPILIIILLTTTFLLLNRYSCIIDKYDYIDEQNPLKSNLNQEVSLKGLPHYFKNSYWLESDGKEICLITDFQKQSDWISHFQNLAKENARSDVKKEIQITGIVKEDIRCFLPCPKNSVTQLKCSETKTKELHYCVKVKEISE